jgi:hypothetical protein
MSDGHQGDDEHRFHSPRLFGLQIWFVPGLVVPLRFGLVLTAAPADGAPLAILLAIKLLERVADLALRIGFSHIQVHTPAAAGVTQM